MGFAISFTALTFVRTVLITYAYSIVNEPVFPETKTALLGRGFVCAHDWPRAVPARKEWFLRSS